MVKKGLKLTLGHYNLHIRYYLSWLDDYQQKFFADLIMLCIRVAEYVEVSSFTHGARELTGRSFRRFIDDSKKWIYSYWVDGCHPDCRYSCSSIYTADEGMYIGEGKLDNEIFEGYYEGPVDGTYEMQRVR